MSLNSSKQQLQTASDLATPSGKITPDYVGLVRTLIHPFLEFPEELKVDCEILMSTSLVWIRVAFSTKDKAKVYGRGGRNIEAIRTALLTAAEVAGQSVYLDVYGGFYVAEEHSGHERKREPHRGSREFSAPVRQERGQESRVIKPRVPRSRPELRRVHNRYDR